jgi:serpin B
MRKPLLWVLAVAVAAVIGFTAFRGDTGQVLRSRLGRDMAPSVSADARERVVAGNTEFALRLYQRLRTEDGNLFFSPYSLSLGLAMTYAGARGETEQQMAQALDFSLPQATLHRALNAVDLELATRGKGARGREGEPFRLHVANALWGQRGYAFLPSFLDLLATNYGAGMRLVNYADPEAARGAINRWVRHETEGKIKELVDSNALTWETRLVLTNVVYFDAAWEQKFPAANTKPGDFTLREGEKVRVPMMHDFISGLYGEGDGYQAVGIPYQADGLYLIALLPAAGQFAEFEASLDAARLTGILKGMDPNEIILTMPRFSYASSFHLRDALVALGMGDAFDAAAADFSGMDGQRFLFLTDVLHQALVRVDEKGTEAAAATAVIAAGGAGPAGPRLFTVVLDRPFIFLIFDQETEAVLFLGRVMDPRG